MTIPTDTRDYASSSTRPSMNSGWRWSFLPFLQPKPQVTIVQLQAPIGGKAVAIPPPDIFAAVAPYYPEDRHGFMIDLSQYDDRNPHFVESAARKIDDVLRSLHLLLGKLDLRLPPLRLATHPK